MQAKFGVTKNYNLHMSDISPFIGLNAFNGATCMYFLILACGVILLKKSLTLNFVSISSVVWSHDACNLSISVRLACGYNSVNADVLHCDGFSWTDLPDSV